jgi:coenzyme F420 hydrogenase subunit beta
MSKSFESIAQVVSWRLCLGCGACVCVCPEGALSLVDVEDDGLRPHADPRRCVRCGECLKVCPGIAIEGPRADAAAIPELYQGWGNVREVWEGWAADPEIRFLGSSGGIATALSLYCLEKVGMAGVLHIGPEAARPLTNAAVLSCNRDDLLRRTGSRYAPAAPCSGLNLLNPANSLYAFVGKPCDVVAVRKWQALNPALGCAVSVAISIFCAGTPSTQGTRRILERLGVQPDEVASLRYRGCGWPGRTVAQVNGKGDTDHSLSYEEAWGTILSKHAQFRCRLCPESTGELADLSCGDPWYRNVEPGEQGRSLVLVRTDRGREVLHGAMDAGYVRLERVRAETLPMSQRALLQRRRQLWGRLLALRASGVPIPQYRGFSLLRNWRSLPLSGKLRSLLGTVHRIYKRKWNRPVPTTPGE